MGRILRRDKGQSRAVVQLQQDEEKLLTLDYDVICHYVGGVEDDWHPQLLQKENIYRTEEFLFWGSR